MFNLNKNIDRLFQMVELDEVFHGMQATGNDSKERLIQKLFLMYFFFLVGVEVGLRMEKKGQKSCRSSLALNRQLLPENAFNRVLKTEGVSTGKKDRKGKRKLSGT